MIVCAQSTILPGVVRTRLRPDVVAVGVMSTVIRQRQEYQVIQYNTECSK